MHETRDTAVFLGPSLPRSEAQAILAATYLPPVRKGDIYALLTSGVRRIVVIDGIFHSGPSVWQRELLAAIDEGIAVFGASSMGALRAAELHTLGMTGVGTVFEWFRDGLLDGDDEVALRHASEEFGYRALSEPLVNIRYTLQRAVGDGTLSPDEAADLVDALKRTYYPDRSYRGVLACPIVQAWSQDRRDGFKAYLATNAIDVKAEDSRRVLDHCARTPIAATPPRVERADPWSLEFRRVALEFRTLADGDRTMAWADLRGGLRRARARWAAACAGVVTRWCVADLARRRAVACTAAEVQAFSARWASEHRVDDVVAWARARGLSAREHAELLAHHALVSSVREAGPDALGLSWDREAAARLAARLPRRASTPRIAADDCAFLSGWLDAHGFSCPRAERARWLAAWNLRTPAQRAAAARALALSPVRFRRALAQRIAATWLVAAGPERFGVMIDVDVLAVQDTQFSTAPAELFAIGGAP
jgi:hypothetical protein